MFRGGGMTVITLWLPEYVLECIQELIQKGTFPHRSELIRAAVRELLKNELTD
jgi:Arc/MetJ-type ribon-helix-helix transcriptional regulator